MARSTDARERAGAQQGIYRIFGSELSPYSVKVRSYFRLKRIAHEWIVRNMNNLEEFGRYAKLPLIPLVITPQDEGLQDSTPIIETLEKAVPEPRLQPDDPCAAFISALIEEYADEWGNKPMFHYRWTYEADQASAAERLARDNLPGASEEAIRETADSLRKRMVPRLRFVGSSEETRDQIERSYRRQLSTLGAHLGNRPYLFGRRPALADLGLFAQLYECSIDPTPGAIMEESAPIVLGWVRRMLNPSIDGDFEPWEKLEPTLAPLLSQEIGRLFLPWSTANARALEAGETEFTVELEGSPFTQQPQKYHAKSLAVLKRRYANVADKARLEPLLERTGCLGWLT